MAELIVLFVCLYALAAALAGLVLLGVYLKLKALLVMTVIVVAVLSVRYWRADERHRWRTDREDLAFISALSGMGLVIVWIAAAFTNWSAPGEALQAVVHWAVR